MRRSYSSTIEWLHMAAHVARTSDTDGQLKIMGSSPSGTCAGLYNRFQRGHSYYYCILRPLRMYCRGGFSFRKSKNYHTPPLPERLQSYNNAISVPEYRYLVLQLHRTGCQPKGGISFRTRTTPQTFPSKGCLLHGGGNALVPNPTAITRKIVDTTV